ncbi:MAG: ATP-dependent metallopeptidase FtsH/Yme1/Tma family protein, partial [Ktedonobacteraceae bacterium]
MMSWLVRLLIFVGIVLLGWYFFSSFLSPSANTGSSNAIEVPYSTFIQQVQQGNVKDVLFQGQDVTGDFNNSVKIPDINGATKSGSTFHFTQLTNGDPSLITLLNKYDVTYQAKPAADSNTLFTILLNVVPWLVLILLFLFIIRRATQGQQNIFSFGKSKARMILEDRPSTTFADVAGVDEARQDLVEIVEFLKTPQKFQRLGGKIPRGVLLVGPPGT